MDLGFPFQKEIEGPTEIPQLAGQSAMEFK
jgi:hypothetical protein